MGRPPPIIASSSDADLWKSYITALRDFVFKGNKLDPKTQAFYAVPIGQMGIVASRNVPEPVTNMGLFQVADTLLDINNPVFTPGKNSNSYIDRESRLLHVVQLKKNTNAGALKRLQIAQKRQEDLQARMDDMRPKAQAAFEEDDSKPENLTFKSWVSRNYPSYDSINSELQQAASACDSAMIEVYGPGSKELTRKITEIRKALDQYDSYPGKNMLVSNQEVDMINGSTLEANASPRYRPSYIISRDYVDVVQQWIADRSSDSGTTKPVMMSIDTSNTSKESWDDLGFPKAKVPIGGQFLFDSTRAAATNHRNDGHLSLAQLGSEVTLTVRATGVKAFDVKPGEWDGDFTNMFRDVSFVENFFLPAACAISQVIMGYNVSLDVSLGPAAANKVYELYSRTKSIGASLSIFGIPIGDDSRQGSTQGTVYNITNNQDDFRNFSITGDDRRRPVVLGVVGRKLPSLGKSR